MFKSRRTKYFLLLTAFLVVFLGAGRLYYALTDGFTLGNITYDLPYEVRRDVALPSEEMQNEAQDILNQKFKYLGKGCQSYVFESEDGSYVLKFFKFQRYRPQVWLDYFTWVPGIETHRQRRLNHKRNKLEKLFSSWKVAYEELAEETGLVYMKLNELSGSYQPFTFYDKLGTEHTVDLAEMQFLVQRKAKMLCPTLKEMLAKGRRDEAQILITKLIDLFLSEYKRGYADFDPAIMQNTGVIDGNPIHVDVGQITHSYSIYEPDVWKQDLFNKTFKFRIWLRKQDSKLADDLDERLESIIGNRFHHMKLTTNL